MKHSMIFWSSKALIRDKHQGDLKWVLSVSIAGHRISEQHPARGILTVATNIQAWIRSTVYSVIQQIMELHPARGIPMDVTNMEVMVNIASIVDRQTPAPHLAPVIQIGVTKDSRGRFCTCERCGAPGKLREGRWKHTYCDNCDAESEANRHHAAH